MAYGSLYKISNRVNGLGYIGQTTQSVLTRSRQHFHRAFNKRPSGSLLAAAIREYSPESFTVEILARAETKQELDRLEIHFIATLQTRAPHGYNLMSGGGHGHHHEKTKCKIAVAHKGRKQPAHVIELNRQRMLGTTVPPEIREKISKALKGRPLSKKTRARMSKARLGKPRPLVHKPWGWPRGIPKPPELRERLRQANLGKKASLLTRMKMSQSQRHKWQERHANNSLHTPMAVSQTA